MAWVRARPCKLQKGYTRLLAVSHKVYQLLTHGTPASSETKTCRHDIAESGVKHQKSMNQSSYVHNEYIYFNIAIHRKYPLTYLHKTKLLLYLFY